MFQGSTDFLSYVLMVFLSWIYLPYTIFRFSAEIFIDLGRKKDSTQLEEIIGAFLPGGLLCAMAWRVFYCLAWFWPDIFKVDWAVIASMFGQNRGAVSDYIYAGNWKGCVSFLIILWGLAIVNGLLFGRAAQLIMRTSDDALYSLDAVMHKFTPPLDLRWPKLDKHLPEKTVKALQSLWCKALRLFWVWHIFFEESLMPLYPWREQHPKVRVETLDHSVYCGYFVAYEETVDGGIDAIRLHPVDSIERSSIHPNAVPEKTKPEYSMVFIKWKRILDISISKPVVKHRDAEK